MEAAGGGGGWRRRVEARHQAARLAGGDLRELETRAERVGLQGVRDRGGGKGLGVGVVVITRGDVGEGVMAGEGVG